MPTVLVRSDRPETRFHRDPECWQAKRRHPSGHHELREVELSNLKYATPCLACHKDAPRAVSVHQRCPLCNKRKASPCEHNGGIPVQMTRHRVVETVIGQTTESWDATIYVWPENLRHHLVLTS